LVIGCSILVDVSIHGGILTITGSLWGEKVITPYFFIYSIHWEEKILTLLIKKINTQGRDCNRGYLNLIRQNIMNK